MASPYRLASHALMFIHFSPITTDTLQTHNLRLDLNKMSQLLTGAQIEAANIATQNEI